jgi:phosphoglycolate phosphatase
MINTRNLKIVVFDMDGTLFNSFTVSYDAVREGFEKLWEEIGESGATPSWQKVKRYIGLPSYEFYPAILDPKYRQYAEKIEEYVGAAERRKLTDGYGRCFDGTHSTLQALKDRGYVLGCLTNAGKRYFDSVMDNCRLREFFSISRHLGESLYLTKSAVLKEWSAENGGGDALIYVGDREGDIRSAHDAGVQAVGVTWGYGSPSELASAEAVIDRMPELLDVLGIGK